MRNDWWFKFEHLKWLTDDQLNRCSLETQGFWIRCICTMHRSGSAELKGTGPELCRLLSVTGNELRRCVKELTETKAANVTFSHASVTQKSAIFTIMSRKLARELNIKEQNRLRKQRERRHAKVTPTSPDRVKSKKKEVDKEEEKRGAADAATEPERVEPQCKPTDPRKSHPVIVAIRDVTNAYPPKETWDELIDHLGRNDIDQVLLKKCFTKWRVKGYNKLNFNWALDWYVNGIPEQGKEHGTSKQYRNGNKPTPAEVIANRTYRQNNSG